MCMEHHVGVKKIPIQKLEHEQGMWTRYIDNLHTMAYEEKVRELNLYSVQGKLLWADLIQIG